MNTRGPMNIFMWNVHNKERFTYEGDSGAMGAPADLSVKIGTLKENPFGLDIDSMYQWWQVFSHAANTNWSLAKRNCSSVVAKCMLVGGANGYAKKPKVPIWTPNSVYEWAKEVRNKIYDLNKMADEIDQNPHVPRNNGEDLKRPWSLEEWKKKSDAGRFAIRYESLKKIDHALQIFHGIRLESKDLSSIERKEEAAIEVLRLIHEQLVSKPDSKRMSAIITLGRQVLTYKKSLNEILIATNRRIVPTVVQDPPQHEDRVNWEAVLNGGQHEDHENMLMKDQAYAIYCAERGLL